MNFKKSMRGGGGDTASSGLKYKRKMESGGGSPSNNNLNIRGSKVVGGATVQLGGVTVRALPIDDEAQLARLLQTQLFAKETDELHAVLRVLRRANPPSVLALAGDRRATRRLGVPGSAATAGASDDDDRSEHGAHKADKDSGSNKPPKESLLCITIKRGNRVRLQSVLYKYQKGKFTGDQTWRLDDLTRFDPVADIGPGAFMLDFGGAKDKHKPFTFVAHSLEKRNEFFWILHQLCQEYRAEQPRTTVDLVELRLLTAEQAGLDDDLDDDVAPEARDLLPATTEKELETLLDAQHIGLESVGELGPRVGVQLVELQGQSIGALLVAEKASADLRESLLEARGEVEEIDTWLNDHNQQLNNMLTYIAQIESKNNRMEETSRNQMLLLAEFDVLLDRLQFADAHSRALEKPDFGSKSGLTQAIKAARQLQHSLEQLAELGDEQRDMVAVKERHAFFAKLRDGFASETSKHIGRLLSTAGDAMLEGKSTKLQWATHDSLHADLAPFEPLAHWLKAADPETFELLRAAYQRVATRVAKHGMRNYFADLRHCIKKERVDHRFMSFDEHARPQVRAAAAAKAGSIKEGSVSASDAFLIGLESTARVIARRAALLCALLRARARARRLAGRRRRRQGRRVVVGEHVGEHAAALVGGGGGDAAGAARQHARGAGERGGGASAAERAGRLEARRRRTRPRTAATRRRPTSRARARRARRRARRRRRRRRTRRRARTCRRSSSACCCRCLAPSRASCRTWSSWRRRTTICTRSAFWCRSSAPSRSTSCRRRSAPARRAARDSSALVVHLLGALERNTVQLFNRFIDEQCDAIRHSKDVGKKTGTLPPCSAPAAVHRPHRGGAECTARRMTTTTTTTTTTTATPAPRCCTAW
jgi:hypothetical protein